MIKIARTPQQIGVAIRQSRNAKRWTQGDLAQRVGVRQATISKLEGGAPGTEIQTVLSVLSALGMELQITSRTTAPDIEDIF
jgi:HTH-type transcriptional regulator / antitoxin HipB